MTASPLRVEHQLCTHGILSARLTRAHTRPAHARRQHAKCGSHLAIRPAAQTPNSGDRRCQSSRVHSRPALDPSSSPPSRVLNSGVCKRARKPPPCQSVSRAGTRAPSPGRAERRPPAGGSAAAAVPGAPSVGLGLGAQRARGLRNPLLRATLLLWAREPPERVLLESGGGAGRGGARTPMGSCQHQQVLWSKPGARLSSTALPSLRLLGPVDRTRFTHRGKLRPSGVGWFICREARPRSLSGVYGRLEASGASASGWVLPARESDLWDFINLGTGKPQQDSERGQPRDVW